MAESAHKNTYALLAEYEDVTSVYKAARVVRDAGYSKWDVFSPFPIHNMDEAMGIGRSKVAWIVGTCAFLGLTFAFVLTGWTSAGFHIDSPIFGWLSGYPVVTAGKPYMAWEQFMPIYFELSVLIASFGALFGMFALNRLPMWHHPLQTNERFLGVSDDRFFIAIEAKDPGFDPEKTRALLEQSGALNIDVVED